MFKIFAQSRAAGLIKQLTDAGEQLEQTRLELETFNQLKVLNADDCYDDEHEDNCCDDAFMESNMTVDGT